MARRFPFCIPLLITLAHESLVVPSRLPRALAEIVVAAAAVAGMPAPAALAGIEASDVAKAIAASLAGEAGADGKSADKGGGKGGRKGGGKGIFLGNFAQQHPQAAQLHALAQSLAELTGARLGFLTEAANSVGGYLASALPSADGLNAATMLGVGDGVPPKAFLLLHAEPELDMADPARARAAPSPGILR